MSTEQACGRRALGGRRVAAALLMLAAVLAADGLAAAGELAVVTDLVGEAVIAGGAEPRRCDVLSYLEEGAEVRVANAARLTLVYLASGREYTFTGEGTLRIDPPGPTVQSGTRLAARELALARETGLSSRDLQGYAQAAIVMRGARAKKLRVLEPRNTSVLDPQPTFRWTAVEPDLQYRFVLSDESGRTVLETLVDGTALRLPPAVTIEEGAYYGWQVEARSAAGAAYRSAAEFRLLPAVERERVERLRPSPGASFSERVLFGILLERMDLRDAARRHWQVLADERPNDVGLRVRAYGP